MQGDTLYHREQLVQLGANRVEFRLSIFYIALSTSETDACRADVLSLEVFPANASTRDAVICTQENVLEGTKLPRLTKVHWQRTRLSHRCIQTCPEAQESDTLYHLRHRVHTPVRAAVPIQRAPAFDGWTMHLGS